MQDVLLIPCRGLVCRHTSADRGVEFHLLCVTNHFHLVACVCMQQHGVEMRLYMPLQAAYFMHIWQCVMAYAGAFVAAVITASRRLWCHSLSGFQ